DDKIKVFRSEWGQVKDFDWFVQFKDKARQRCSGEWCILLDCDEFIPEWEFPRIRECLETTRDTILPIELINFYGNYKVYNRNPKKVAWPTRKYVIHRNLPDIQVWVDGSHVRQKGAGPTTEEPSVSFPCHHFGFVRHAARLREKWRNIQNIHHERVLRWKLPSFFFNWRPHNWRDPQFLGDLDVY